MDKTTTTSRIRTKKISVFLALVCLWAVLLSSVHHHEDADRHHDCPICVFLGQPAVGASVVILAGGYDESVGCACRIESVCYISKSLFLCGPQRAPPA